MRIATRHLIAGKLLALGAAAALAQACNDRPEVARAGAPLMPTQAAAISPVTTPPPAPVVVTPIAEASAEPIVEPIAVIPDAVAPVAIPPSYQACLVVAAERASAGAIGDAITIYEAAAAMRPAAARPHIELGRLHLGGGRLEAARKHAEVAVELAPGSSGAWNTLGRVALAERDLPAAEASFQRAIEESDTNGFAWNNLGLVRLREQRWDEAAAALERATTSPAPEPYMWNNLGMAYEHLGRVADARDAYTHGKEAGSGVAAQNFARLDGVPEVRVTAKVGDVEIPLDGGIAPNAPGRTVE